MANKPVVVMPDVAVNRKQVEETDEQKLRRLEAENKALKEQIEAEHAPKALKLKVTEKGGLSVYGLGRFPVTLYREQWERLLSDECTTAIKTVLPKMPTKAQQQKAAA